MGKLVRDKIPDMIRARGEKPILEDVNKVWFERCLRMKLIEEAQELMVAEDHPDIIDEMADCLEVLQEICIQNGMAWSHVEDRRKAKREERGGFEGCQYLIRTMPSDV